jgi:hypothetical protein
VNADEYSEALAQELCQSFAVRPVGDQKWAVGTPLLYDDGDSLPVFVEHSTSWRLTDEGMAVSHLYFDDFEYTEPRLRRIQLLAEAHGVGMSKDHELVLELDGPPSAYDIGTFLQLVAQVRGVALTASTEREQTRYAITLRERVVERLAVPSYDPNWSPPTLRTRANYKADLHILTDDDADVVVFAASTSDKANVSALTVNHFKKVIPEMRPVLAYYPDKVNSEAIFRFQDEVEDDDAVVPVPPEDITRLLSALRDRGVAV